MRESYLTDGAISVKDIRHDLQGLLSPLETGLKCMKSGEVTDGLCLQEEVLRKLNLIIKVLDATPSTKTRTQKEME